MPAIKYRVMLTDDEVEMLSGDHNTPQHTTTIETKRAFCLLLVGRR